MASEKLHDGAAEPSRETIDEQRRRFLALMGGISAAWVGVSLYPVYRYLGPLPGADPFGEDGKARVENVSLQDVARPGMGKNGSYGGRGLVIFRAKDGSLRAFDSKCTHAGCNVTFKGDVIVCHCHGGRYDLTGKNIAGPPPRPLTPLKVIAQDGQLYVSRIEGQPHREV